MSHNIFKLLLASDIAARMQCSICRDIISRIPLHSIQAIHAVATPSNSGSVVRNVN